MITKAEIEEAYNRGECKKHRNFYYYELDHVPTQKEIIEKNKLKIALSEWSEVYILRCMDLKLDLSVENAIVIITHEECVAFGL